MNRADLNTIEFYGPGDEILATVNSAVVPQERQHIRIDNTRYMVVSVDHVIDYKDFPAREMRVLVTLQDTRLSPTSKGSRVPKGIDDLVHIRWNK